MGDVARRLAHTLAQFFDFLLLPLVILLPLQAFGFLCLYIGVVVSLVLFEVVGMLINLEDRVNGAVEDLPVMRDEERRAFIAGDVGIEQFQAGKMGVVGRFIV